MNACVIWKSDEIFQQSGATLIANHLFLLEAALNYDLMKHLITQIASFFWWSKFPTRKKKMEKRVAKSDTIYVFPCFVSRLGTFSVLVLLIRFALGRQDLSSLFSFVNDQTTFMEVFDQAERSQKKFDYP
jgi:hypothetical protein